jgi:hypothetical protein
MRVTSVPFANGTEGEAWMDKWCAYCVHDHAEHDGCTDDSNGGCILILEAMCGSVPDTEAWVAEPDDGTFSLPSRMLCTLFQPCTKDECEGDPGAEARAARVGDVMAYWRDKAVNQ